MSDDDHMSGSYRNFVSIILVFLMVMNSIGHYAVLIIARNRTAISATKKLQSNLNEPGGNFIIKLPLAIPYGPDSKAYESARGHFTFEGKVYQILSQKLYQDTLYVVCVHDRETTAANEKVNDYVKSFASHDDIDRTGFKLMPSFEKYCVTIGSAIQSSNSGWTMTSSFGDIIFNPDHALHINVFHPPQSVS